MSTPAVSEAVHPALVGLLRLLPEPRTAWAGKADWLKAFLATFEVVYPDD